MILSAFNKLESYNRKRFWASSKRISVFYFIFYTVAFLVSPLMLDRIIDTEYYIAVVPLISFFGYFFILVSSIMVIFVSFTGVYHLFEISGIKRSIKKKWRLHDRQKEILKTVT